jgi:hypothetical protein
MYDLPRSGTTLFASFSGKRRILPLREYCGAYIIWGQAPKPPNPQCSLRSKLWTAVTFREAEQRFLPLFLEKEEYCHSENTMIHILLLFASSSGKRRIVQVLFFVFSLIGAGLSCLMISKSDPARDPRSGFEKLHQQKLKNLTQLDMLPILFLQWRVVN